MRDLIFAVVSATGLFAAAAASAAGAERVTGNSVEAIAVNDPGRIVCAYSYHEGTVIRRPVCETAQYWANLHDRTRREIRDYQLRRLVNAR